MLDAGDGGGSIVESVFICSPFAGDTERNTAIARQLCKQAIREGYAPFAPHLLYPQFLDDSVPEERALGIRLGHEFMSTCGQIWLYADAGITDGMRQDIVEAICLRIPVRIARLQVGSHSLPPRINFPGRFTQRKGTLAPYPWSDKGNSAEAPLAKREAASLASKREK